MNKNGNMYSDNKKSWNVFVGCYFDCVYCVKSFQAQMKRQMPKHNEENQLIRGCQDCYDYKPHFHENRLKDKLPLTKGDEFIWCCASSDIYFAKEEWIEMILEKIRTYPIRTFFFQTKDPSVFKKYDFPNNVLLGTTLESNRAYYDVSKAPETAIRFNNFLEVKHHRKIITIEPIMEFDLYDFAFMIKKISPERIYIGYDTKNSNLNEPLRLKTLRLIQTIKLDLPDCKIKTKLMREKV